MTTLIRSLSEVGPSDLGAVGGKAANLGALLQAGFKVPPGFCVTTEAYRLFVATSPAAGRLIGRLDELRPDETDRARELAAELRETLGTAQIPSEVIDAVRDAWRRSEDADSGYAGHDVGRQSDGVDSGQSVRDASRRSDDAWRGSYDASRRSDDAWRGSYDASRRSDDASRRSDDASRMSYGASHRSDDASRMSYGASRRSDDEPHKSEDTWRGQGVAGRSTLHAAGDPEAAYAVRSSATAEDLPHASFAGQQETYLNVVGIERLLEAVKACWLSLFTDRATVYRTRSAMGHGHVGLAVVVQRMIPSDVSGTMFTADPVTGHRGRMRIEASYGLGEALVSGRVSPDGYVVAAGTATLLEWEMGAKEIAILPVAGGGTEEVELESGRRGTRVLNDRELTELTDVGGRIEALFDVPQDIEWAIRAGELYILQSRPITTLFPLPSPRPADECTHAYLCINHLQVMLDPISPLGIDVLRNLVPVGDKADKARTLPSAAGRIFVDVSNLLRSPLRHRLARAVSVADRHVSGAFRVMAEREGFQSERGCLDHGQLRRLARTLGPVVAEGIAYVAWRDPSKAREKVEGLLAAVEGRVVSSLAEFDRQSAPDSDSVERLRRLLWDIFPQVMRVPPVIFAGIVSEKLLRTLVGDAQADVDRLLRALPANVTTAMDLAVADLAVEARRSPAVVSRLTQSEAPPTLDDLRQLDGGGEFAASIDGFLAQYGMRGAGEIDIASPRWRDDPMPVIQVVAGNLAGDAEDHRARFDALIGESTIAAERLIASSSKGILGPLRGKVVAKLVRNTRAYQGLREHPKFLLVRLLDEVRTLLLAWGEAYVGQGALLRAGDIYWLTFDDLKDPAGSGGWQSIVEQRRSEYVRYREMNPPRVVTSDGERIVQPPPTDLPPNHLPGTPASTGIVEGIARVLVSPDERLEAGQILVTRFTDPGWTPLFVNAAGLVMEVGGMMTHGSVVAREYGIPAVVGVLDATERIESGQRIRVDGDQGVVVLLEP